MSAISIVWIVNHDDVIKWKHFPRYWPFERGIPAQRPVTRSFDVFFDLRLNKRLSKQSWGWWIETLSRSLWRHCNVLHQVWCSSYMSCNWEGVVFGQTKVYKDPIEPWGRTWSVTTLTHWGQAKWPPYCRRQFQIHFISVTLESQPFSFNVYGSIHLSQKLVPKGSVGNKAASVQVTN